MLIYLPYMVLFILSSILNSNRSIVSHSHYQKYEKLIKKRMKNTHSNKMKWTKKEALPPFQQQQNNVRFLNTHQHSTQICKTIFVKEKKSEMNFSCSSAVLHGTKSMLKWTHTHARTQRNRGTWNAAANTKHNISNIQGKTVVPLNQHTILDAWRTLFT